MVPPFAWIGGANIYLSGKFVVLETSFHLRVRFDGNHHADVTVPSSYNGQLCGLCGKNIYIYTMLLVYRRQKLLLTLIAIKKLMLIANFNTKV